MIPISRPDLGPEELEEVRKVFDSGWLGLGATVLEFEKAVSAYLGGRPVVAVNTGTSALHIALDALGVGPGDEVVLPSLTFAATPQAVLACGAKPVFCDVETDTLNLDLADVERRLTPRTKAVIPVHYGGLPCDMDRLLGLAAPRNVRVVEDAAHAFGSTCQGRRIGSFGDVTCLSFDPIKVVTCGEGGAVVLPDEKLAEEVRRKRILGIDKDTWNRYRHERAWFYEVVTRGFRYHMPNINAAIGLAQLRKLERFLSRRLQVARAYDDAFRGVAGLELLRRDYEATAFFAYIIKVKDGRRDGLLDALNKAGVGAGVHYIPNHIQPLFKEFAGPLPATDLVWTEILSLPLYSSITDAQVESVIAAVRTCLR